MKNFRKLLVLAFSTVLAFGLSACNQPTEEPTSVPTDTPEISETETPTVEDSSTTEVAGFNAAESFADYYYGANKDTKLAMKDFTLPTVQQTFDDEDNVVLVNLAWELVVDGGVEGAVTLGDVDEKGNQTVTIVYNAETSVVETPFVLKCTVTDPNGNTASFELQRTVPQFQYATFEDFKANLGSDEVLNVSGTVVAIYKSGVYLMDDAGYGYYAYSPVFEGTMDAASLMAAYPLGSRVLVSGTATSYNGQYEFSKGCAVKKVADAPADWTIPYEDATQAFIDANSPKDSASLDHLQNKVVSISGVTIANIDAANYYYYFTIGEDQVKFYLRTSGSFNDFTNEMVNQWVKDWTEGYTADIKGLVTVYSNNFYITPLEESAVTITNASLSDAAKVEVALGSAERTYGITYEASQEVELPTTDDNGVSYTYEVVSGSSIAVNGGKLVVTAGSEATTNVLKVTATSGSVTESTEITVNVAAALPTVTPIADRKSVV